MRPPKFRSNSISPRQLNQNQNWQWPRVLIYDVSFCSLATVKWRQKTLLVQWMTTRWVVRAKSAYLKGMRKRGLWVLPRNVWHRPVNS
jgi:hypothetical protein